MKSYQGTNSGREAEPLDTPAGQEPEEHGRHEAMEMSEGGTSWKLSLIDEIIFYGLIIASLVGVVTMEASVSVGAVFWLAMVPIMGVATIYIEWAKVRAEGIRWLTLVRTQILHWGSLLVAIEIVRLIAHFGRLNNEAVSLVTLLLLAQTTFLVGVYVDWRFGVVALFQVLCIVTLAYLEAYIWLMLLVAIGLIAIGIYFHRKFPHKTPTYQH